jgi:predicted AlkP superfamily pyrophosphatase or phosphodiesterase
MTWIPIFKVASIDFEGDLKILKQVMNSYEKKVHFDNGYKFSSESQFAMGWWFYEIFVKLEFFKKLVQIEHDYNQKIQDERDVLKIIQKQLKTSGSKAKITINSKPSVFKKYWVWLLK